MAFRNDGDESPNDDNMGGNLMDMEYFLRICNYGWILGTHPTPSPRHYSMVLPWRKFPNALCTMHQMMPWKGRCKLPHQAMEMFHEKNLGRIQDKQAYDDEVANLKKGHDHLYTEYHKMVHDVSKMFDWRDGVGKVDYHKAMDAERFENNNEELEMEMEMEMEKLRLAKEHKCILKAYAHIIQNTKKAMKNKFSTD
ncbi:putative polyprotein [Hordeum vulgare]|nr:putative polyprotein [Hordeum vulgare]